MASLALPAPLPASLPEGPRPPFDAPPEVKPPPATSSHIRRHSRNPTAHPLPAFSFNPGAANPTSGEGMVITEGTKADKVALEAPVKGRRPPPLPAFTFNPGAAMEREATPSPTHPILEEMALNQQRSSRSARPAPLPAFNFSPGTAGSVQLSPSPSKSDFGDVSAPVRIPSGHRRQGSEFVVGGVEGTPLISTSPQKAEARLQGPPVSAYNPRGHVHRRSQAISISDIPVSELIKTQAISKHRAGSAPSTPSDAARPHFFAHSPQHQSVSNIVLRSPAASPNRGTTSTSRTRVGFSDTVDVIPRPLSLISSETEGSTSTVRGSHSLSESLNSIGASPSPRPKPMLSWSDGEICPKKRPQTADPSGLSLLNSPVLNGSDTAVSLPKRPLSASGSPAATSTGSPPTKRKLFWFTHSAENSPIATPVAEQQDPISALPYFLPNSAAEVSRPKTSPERTASIKKRKVRSWTHGIFSRKSKPRSPKTKAKRMPTPPLLTRRTSDQLEEMFDADDTIVIANSPSLLARRASAPAAALLMTGSPATKARPESRITSPIIDLDAALGPVGSEERFEDNASHRAASRMANLHSSERRAVDAFGTSHRRAESAPQMPPVNRSIFGLHHVGSNASLAGDVFDEEEEDKFLAGEKNSDELRVTATEPLAIAPTSESSQPSSKSSAISPVNRPAETLGDGLGLSMPSETADAIVIVDTDDTFHHARARSSNSTLEAPVLPESDIPKRPASSPMDFAYHVPHSNYASSTEGRTTTNSLISSPDAEHLSFDNRPRLNRSLGEPSPEVGIRASNDDLPSLTDSVSTGNVPRISSSANTRCSIDQRSTCVSGPSVTKSNQAWKRASLASLNRLIPGSSNGSKLKFEAVPNSSEEQKIKRKSNRIGKLLHFWRSKETAEC